MGVIVASANRISIASRRGLFLLCSMCRRCRITSRLQPVHSHGDAAMTCTDTPSFTVVAGSSHIVAMRWINIVTDADFVPADVHAITETITDQETGDAVDRTLDKDEVVLAAPQTSPLIKGGKHLFNVRVVTLATSIEAGKTYDYQLTIVPDDGSGGADTNHVQKSRVVELVGV